MRLAPSVSDSSSKRQKNKTGGTGMESSMKRVALVTGANKGIGFEAARQIAGAGCTVLLGARDKSRGEAAAATLQGEGLDVRYLAIDLGDHATASAAAAVIDDEFGRLDILVNNAGISDRGDGPPSKASLGAIEKVLQTNFVDTVAVTQAMLPLLRKAPAARIVNVSSGLGSLTQNGDPDYEYAFAKSLGYCASKAALNMMTVQLAYELRDTAIKVNSADPGYTATDLNGNSGPQTVPEGAAETIRLALLGEDGPSGSYSDSKGVVAW
jgi:NAD(P)-dependent dehydrogenase (short-subunit alcohol dehydrogenase family)